MPIVTTPSESNIRLTGDLTISAPYMSDPSLDSSFEDSQITEKYLQELSVSALNFIPILSTGGTGDIVATLNASTEGLKITTSLLEIDGSVTFSAGYDPTDKVDELGGSYASAASGARVLVFPDVNTGLQIIDDAANNVFLALVGGTNVGDVAIGNYSGGEGIFYDKSANTLYVRGSLNADDITAGTITGRTILSGTGNARSVMNWGEYGLAVFDDNGDSVFKAFISGSNIGDVEIGDFGSSKGLKWDKSSGTFQVKGSIIMGAGSSLSADYINAGSLSANYISGGTLSGVTVQSSSGNDRIVLNTGDYLDFYIGGSLQGRLRGTSSASGGVRVVGGDLAIDNDYSLLFDETGGSGFFKVAINSSDQGIISLPRTNQLFIKDDDESENMFTLSKTQMYSKYKFVCDGDIELNDTSIKDCDQIVLNKKSSGYSSDYGSIYYYEDGGNEYFGSNNDGWDGRFSQVAQ